MSKELCLSEKTGSCAGCNVHFLALRDLNLSPDNHTADEVASEIGAEYCPGNLVPIMRKDESIYPGFELNRLPTEKGGSGKKISKSSTNKWYQ